jgi:hypothetical protein
MGMLDKIIEKKNNKADIIINIVESQGQQLINKWGDPANWNLEDKTSMELQSDLEHSSLRVMLLIQQELGDIFSDKTLIEVIKKKLDASIEDSYKFNQGNGMSADDNKLNLCINYLVRMPYMNNLISRHISSTKLLVAA